MALLCWHGFRSRVRKSSKIRASVQDARREPVSTGDKLRSRRDSDTMNELVRALEQWRRSTEEANGGLRVKESTGTKRDESEGVVPCCAEDVTQARMCELEQQKEFHHEAVGDCLVVAVSQALQKQGLIFTAEETRQQLVEHMERHSMLYAKRWDGVMPNGSVGMPSISSDFREYLRAARCSGAWLGALEWQAASELYEVQVELYERGAHTKLWRGDVNSPTLWRILKINDHVELMDTDEEVLNELKNSLRVPGGTQGGRVGAVTRRRRRRENKQASSTKGVLSSLLRALTQVAGGDLAELLKQLLSALLVNQDTKKPRGEKSERSDRNRSKRGRDKSNERSYDKSNDKKKDISRDKDSSEKTRSKSPDKSEPKRRVDTNIDDGGWKELWSLRPEDFDAPVVTIGDLQEFAQQHEDSDTIDDLKVVVLIHDEDEANTLDVTRTMYNFDFLRVRVLAGPQDELVATEVRRSIPGKIRGRGQSR